MKTLMEIFQRIGAGMAASHQGEYLHGWLPAMALRPDPALSGTDSLDTSGCDFLQTGLVECEGTSGAY